LALIVGVTGMPGAGKTTAARHLSDFGYAVLGMGDVIRDEVARRGLPPGIESQTAVLRAVRGEYGPAALVELLRLRIESTAGQGRTVVLDGVRSPAEVERLGTIGTVRVLAIYTSPQRRFERLRLRGRPDDPRTPRELAERDRQELALGMGAVIALADDTVINEWITPEELGAAAAAIVGNWAHPGPAGGTPRRVGLF